MDATGTPELERIRCAAFRSASGADPVGTATSHRAFLCVTVPLPWERDISTSPPFDGLGGTPVVTGAGGRRWRAQGLAPDGEDGAAVLAFVAAEGPDGSVGPFRRTEWRVDADRTASLCRAVLDGDAAALAAHDDHRVDTGDDVVDVLVCGHGRRDTCCGAAGVALAEQFSPMRSLRVWRTSHLGGHRFAATAVTFPDGYAWAHLGPSDLVGLGFGRWPDLGACRGWSALDPGPRQVADREGLALAGPGWADGSRRAVITAHDRRTRATTVAVSGQLAAGELVLEVDVEVVDHLPTPTCGSIDEPEFAVEPVWAATAVRVLSDTRRG